MQSLSTYHRNASIILLLRFCGSYEAVVGGRIEEALMHMTGGMGEIIPISKRRAQDRNFRENLKLIIWQAYKHKSLLGCSISVIYISTKPSSTSKIELMNVSAIDRCNRRKACQWSCPRLHSILLLK